MSVVISPDGIFENLCDPVICENGRFVVRNSKLFRQRSRLFRHDDIAFTRWADARASITTICKICGILAQKSQIILTTNEHNRCVWTESSNFGEPEKLIFNLNFLTPYFTNFFKIMCSYLPYCFTMQERILIANWVTEEDYVRSSVRETPIFFMISKCVPQSERYLSTDWVPFSETFYFSRKFIL